MRNLRRAVPARGLTSIPTSAPIRRSRLASAGGATNRIPFFITSDGPVREARLPFVVTSGGSLTKTPDGGVHALFTIAGRGDAGSCSLAQPNFEQMAQLHNLIFRIPTPVFGAGLIENIADATILANMRANSFLKGRLGISGHPNFSGNDGTITRFGWKRKTSPWRFSLARLTTLRWGVTNELFPDERGTPPAACLHQSDARGRDQL